MSKNISEKQRFLKAEQQYQAARKPPGILLASASPARRELLGRICPEFRTIAANIDEETITAGSPGALAAKLSALKANAVVGQPDAAGHQLVIGSDQVATTGDERIGKPGNAAANIEQLQRLSGREVTFYTAVCLLDSRTGSLLEHIDITRVEFRKLSTNEIRNYVMADTPWQCAGGFKAESLGITLFRRIVSEDPTGLIGLPLIATARMLRDSNAIVGPSRTVLD